ncbi:NAD(P)-dependent alcohol dehydrogenase [Arthrobacter sp. NPDC093125]|uniref:NAD(P)-dependent alcohol dehydrogenase n=1 Tax=Arthrobacter sp. NPDC093125 TaxID=3363944 RepID=UPI0037FDF8BA
MRAAVYRKYGPANVVQVQDVAKPAPAPGEVLIKVHTSTLSAADYRARTLDVPRGLRIPSALSLGIFRPRTPILGMDAAGVIEAVGAAVTTFTPGDEVIAMLGARFGGHAEYVTVPQNGIIATKPRNMSFEQAVTLVFGGLPALGFMKHATIKPGDSILINGASGAVGTAAVQLAKHFGADVTGVCSRDKAELVASLGADTVIDYSTHDFTADSRTYDVIMDCAGNASFERVEGLLRPGGALLLVIADLKAVLLARARSRRSGKLVVVSAGKYTAEDLAFLVALAESGAYRAVIDRTYDLPDIVEAHRFVESGRKRGNVVVRVAATTSSPAPPDP